MALIIAGTSVATAMSSLVEKTLRQSPFLVPGLTYTDRYSMSNAGQIQVNKYTPGSVTAPKAPGSNFTSTDYATSQVVIEARNTFQEDKAVRGVVAATMPVTLLANAVIDVSENVRVSRDATAIAVLAAEGTLSTDTDAITALNVKEVILEHKAHLTKKFARPNVVVCSVDTYAAILSAAGAEFTPMRNDQINATGQIGMWLGMLFVESNFLDGVTSTYAYVNGSGAVTTVDTSGVDFIMYDFEAFSIIDVLSTLRTVDAEDFIGVRVQDEILSAMKVTNPDCVLVKK